MPSKQALDAAREIHNTAFNTVVTNADLAEIIERHMSQPISWPIVSELSETEEQWILYSERLPALEDYPVQVLGKDGKMAISAYRSNGFDIAPVPCCTNQTVEFDRTAIAWLPLKLAKPPVTKKSASEIAFEKWLSDYADDPMILQQRHLLFDCWTEAKVNSLENTLERKGNV